MLARAWLLSGFSIKSSVFEVRRTWDQICDPKSRGRCDHQYISKSRWKVDTTATSALSISRAVQGCVGAEILALPQK